MAYPHYINGVNVNDSRRFLEIMRLDPKTLSGTPAQKYESCKQIIHELNAHLIDTRAKLKTPDIYGEGIERAISLSEDMKWVRRIPEQIKKIQAFQSDLYPGLLSRMYSGVCSVFSWR